MLHANLSYQTWSPNIYLLECAENDLFLPQQAQNANALGQGAVAQDASKTARTLNVIGLVCGIILIIIFIVLKVVNSNQKWLFSCCWNVSGNDEILCIIGWSIDGKHLLVCWIRPPKSNELPKMLTKMSSFLFINKYPILWMMDHLFKSTTLKKTE